MEKLQTKARIKNKKSPKLAGHVNPQVRRSQEVEEIANAESVNRNDAIRMALATEQFVSRVRREGGKILIKDKDGEIREVEFILR